MSRIKWCNQVLDDVLSPSVGVDKTIVRAEDGTSIGIQNTITVKGYILATGDPYSGQRQDVLYKRINDFLIKGNRGDNLNQQGLLEIIPVNGGANVLKFDNAQLTTLSLPEPPDETAGIQYQEYSFTFDAFENVGPTNSGDLFNRYRLKSVNESWEIAKNEDQAAYLNEDFTSTFSHYTYTLTHTLSAVGMQDYKDGNISSTAWKQAYNYVVDKLQDTSPTSVLRVNKDSYNNDTSGYSVFNLNKWTVESGTTLSTPYTADLDSNFVTHNQVRTGTVDIAGGSYSATSTYLLTNGLASYDINIRYDESEEGDIGVSVEGTVSPISTGTFNLSKNLKYSVSNDLFDKISDSGAWTKVTSLAQQTTSYYKDSGNNSIFIDSFPRSVSVGRNKNNGQISFTLGYKGISSEIKNLKSRVTGAIAVSLSVQQDNPLYAPKPSDAKFRPLQFQQIAVIPILGKSDGPVIQSIGTTKERKKTVTMDVTMKQGYRTPSGSPALMCYQIISGYAPVSNNKNGVYVQNFTDQWDWVNGKYNLTVDWIYT